jgi:hypothetical protein
METVARSLAAAVVAAAARGWGVIVCAFSRVMRSRVENKIENEGLKEGREGGIVALRRSLVGGDA